MRTQFNVRLHKAIQKRIKDDKANLGATRDVITEVALEDFFSRYNPKQRDGFYRNHTYRPYARAGL